MNDFLEFDEKKKAVKSLNLDDYSVEELNKYISELENEIMRVKLEKEKKSKLLREAQKFFS